MNNRYFSPHFVVYESVSKSCRTE